MELMLSGKRVESILVEYSLRMQLSEDYFVVVESPLVLQAGGETFSLSPEVDPDEAFEPLRALVGQLLTSATVDPRGTLRISFDDGAHLQVEPDDAYEAWNVSGPDGALVVCMPGGTIANWSAQTDADEPGHPEPRR